MLFDADEIAEGVAGIMVQAAWFRAHEHPLLHDRSLASAASMAPCAAAGASVGSGLSETLGCRSRKCNDPIPVRFSVKVTPPPHLDLECLQV
ncbi:hypothetical protein ACFX13_021675 [Malus domestica]